VELAWGDDPNAEPYENITRKYQYGQQLALDGGYEALMTVEDDIVVPPDAYSRLAALDCDVAYGLTVWRNSPHHWSAVLELGGQDHHVSLDEYPDRRQELWGGIMTVVGCGLFCTLIRRHVLEAIPFRRTGRHCCDWDFALDCADSGFVQKADLSVVCGHLTGDGLAALWPDPATGFRAEVIRIAA